jgi:hypothetical protein
LKSPTPDEGKPLSKRDEQRLLEAGRSVFSTAFPNPDRQGCPAPDLIRAIAYRKADPAQHRDFIVHMSRCSPCFNDFARLQEEAKRARRRRGLGVAAGVVLVIGLALFAWSERRRLTRPEGVQVATLDLTHRGVLRGEASGPPKPPLELSADLLELTVYLPVGSEPGAYELQILKQASAPVWSGEGQANSENQGVVLRFKVDLSAAKPGPYFLAIRRVGWDWVYYPLVVK